MGYTSDELIKIAKDMRKSIFKMIYKAGGGHISPSFSIVEILTTLYFGGILKYDPKQPQMPERDRFILSKGHAGTALYAILARAGFFDESVLDTYCKPGSILGGHPDTHKIPGIEASTGALGHGFLYANGIALAGKMDRADYNVYALLGDGECQEGSIWEAALFASHHQLGNFTAIIDYNKLQAMDNHDKIVRLEPFADKWRAFGWDVHEVDGHNIEALMDILGKPKQIDSAPRAVIAHTVKGKGVSYMENAPLWHFRLPNSEELKIAMEELDISAEELI